MISDRAFQFTLLISATFHLAVLFQNNALFDPAEQNRKNKDDLVEINYLKVLEKDIVPAKESGIKLETPASLASRITAAKRSLPSFIGREAAAKEKNMPQHAKNSIFVPSLLKKPEIKPDIITAKRMVSLSHVDIDKINNPSYLNYFQIIREKIKRCVSQGYSSSDTGDVYVSFIVSSTGYLEAKRVVDEKTSANSYLKDIALKSVDDASPFPKFPSELNYPQLPFNVIISFKIE